ncbi:glycoside hydrolase family 13 protein [Teratosphaeria destructans]|uniref:Glycoside hydrolase family 13 protein n=1 Tax=Teratosphaeria destructans TaxID=418781 RepID=A0A9W7W547_9PEZI|nr:glycoside hydrolase family 13 protein [Teratosphaeria destructans]
MQTTNNDTEPQNLLAPRKWWHTASIYQIYPASFKDSNGDGWGDLRGIISKADYIADLGVDAVWLSPCYTSPYVDNGYDISDYCDIDPRFGTLGDIDVLIAALGTRGVKLIMDLVVNHTSDQHAWFLESRAGVESKKRDWYIWRPGRQVTLSDGTRVQQPPNNWRGQFGGSAWTYDEGTGEWYFHCFAPNQPDLNWENPELRRTIYEMMRFWLEKGIAGFRMDVINMISKPTDFPDADVVDAGSLYQPAEHLYYNGPRVHDYLQEMRREVMDRYPDTMTVGETPCTDTAEAVRQYVEPERAELDMVFQYDVFSVDFGPTGKFSKAMWSMQDVRDRIVRWQHALSYASGAWPTFFLETHDSARSVSRFGDGKDENRWKVAKMLALLGTTLGGTLFVYQGQELGMVNLGLDVPVQSYSDIETKAFLKQHLDSRQAGSPNRLRTVDEGVAEQIRLKARDHTRTPFPWDNSHPFAGFTDGPTPWERPNSDFEVCNVSQQEGDVESVLYFWRQMLRFRKQHKETLCFGDFYPVDTGSSPVFAYFRKPVEGPGNEGILVVINLGDGEDVEFELPHGLEEEVWRYVVLRGTHAGRRGARAGKLLLRSYEGLVLGYQLVCA